MRMSIDAHGRQKTAILLVIAVLFLVLLAPGWVLSRQANGLPSSSRMYEPLLQRLSDRYHLIAPDYPGFGHSDWPDHTQFAYTFDHIAIVTEHVTEALGLTHYSLYMQDYGGPVGFRLALAHPERVQSLIVQDAVAHESGLGENWNLSRAFWADRATYEATLRSNLLS